MGNFLYWIAENPVGVYILIVAILLISTLLSERQPYLATCLSRVWSKVKHLLLQGFGLWLVLFTFTIFVILLIHEIDLIGAEIFDSTSSGLEYLDYLNSIIRSLGIIFSIGLISFALYWLFNNKVGIVILPFDVIYGPSEHQSLVPNHQEKKYTVNQGSFLANLLIEEIHRIKSIHMMPREFKDDSSDEINLRLEFRNFPPLTSLEHDLGEALADLGTIEFGNAKLSLGSFLLSIKRAWPFGGVNGIISGSVRTNPRTQEIVARIDYGNKISAWKATQENCQGTVFISEDMIRELAYKIVFDLIPKKKLPARTWKALREITEAIACFEQYFRTNIDSALDQAYNHLEQALKKDVRLETCHDIHSETLADFFYRIGLSYLLRNKHEEAGRAIKQALKLDQNSNNLCFYYNALGNVYLAQEKTEKSELHYRRSIDEYEKSKQTKSRNEVDNWFKVLIKYLTFHYYDLTYKLFSLLYQLRLRNSPPASLKYKAKIFAYPYNGIGNICWRQKGDFSDASQGYNKAIEIDRHFWKSYHNLGVIYLYQNTFHFCEKDFRKAHDMFEKGLYYCSKPSSACHSGISLANLFLIVSFEQKLLANHVIFRFHIAHLITEESVFLSQSLVAKKILQFLDRLYTFGNILTERETDQEQRSEIISHCEYQMLRAMDLSPKENYLNWNLGLIYAWQSRFDMAYQQWEIAANKAQADNKHFCSMVYRCAKYSLKSRHFDGLKNYHSSIKGHYSGVNVGNLKNTIKDLEVIRLSVFKAIIAGRTRPNRLQDITETYIRISLLQRSLLNLLKKIEIKKLV